MEARGTAPGPRGSGGTRYQSQSHRRVAKGQAGRRRGREERKSKAKRDEDHPRPLRWSKGGAA